MLYLPEAQSMQMASDVAPYDPLHLPAIHLMQFVPSTLPTAVPYLPAERERIKLEQAKLDGIEFVVLNLSKFFYLVHNQCKQTGSPILPLLSIYPNRIECIQCRR